jgi:microsomal dipeptidase-like Zn-dependent dipeptidase
MIKLLRIACRTNQEVRYMNRREFLIKSAICGAAVLLGDANTLVFGDSADKGRDILSGMLILDPHAHPDMNPAAWNDNSASYKFMRAVGMSASCYSAIGDSYNSAYRYYANKSAYEVAVMQLRWWLDGIIKEGRVKLVLKTSDIPGPGFGVPGAILGIEGGDALEGRTERVDEFYKMGVRIITLMHYHNNEIGDIMKVRSGTNPGPFRGGLSRQGRTIISRMQELGMAVDVAHAEKNTLRQIAEMSKKPLIESHTSLCRPKADCGRLRTFEEMELVAKTGGVVCSWPLGWHRSPQRTFSDWADELMLMKKRIGIEHVGIGTDGGGSIWSVVDGYSDVRDLGSLAAAMQDKGFSRQDIAAVMGGNTYRVLKACIG